MYHSIFVFSLINVLGVSGGWQGILLTLESVSLFTLIPRFIVSIREMYARDVRRRGDGIDTWFGLSSSGRSGGTAIVFADDGQNEGLEDVEEILMEAGTTQPE